MLVAGRERRDSYLGAGVLAIQHRPDLAQAPPQWGNRVPSGPRLHPYPKKEISQVSYTLPTPIGFGLSVHATVG